MARASHTAKPVALGVDPGTARLGYALVAQDGPQPRLLACGVLTTEAEEPAGERLRRLYEGLHALIAQYQPTEVAVEQLFFNQNVRTAIAVGQARGVVLLVAAQAGLPVCEYTPLQVKLAIVGYGRARKEQVQEMVRLLLGLPAPPQPDDAADAVAIALCHLQHQQQRQNWQARGVDL